MGEFGFSMCQVKLHSLALYCYPLPWINEKHRSAKPSAKNVH